MEKRERSKCERPRCEKGQFVKFSGNQTYKQCQVGGIRKMKHVAIWEKYYSKAVPKGCLIHHINEGKQDNRIENLQLMTHKEHNQHHHRGKTAWNKGLPKEQQPAFGRRYKFKESSKYKQKCTWFNKNLDCCIEIWKMKDFGMNMKDISKKLNITFGEASARWRGLINVYDIKSGRLR